MLAGLPTSREQARRRDRLLDELRLLFMIRQVISSTLGVQEHSGTIISARTRAQDRRPARRIIVAGKWRARVCVRLEEPIGNIDAGTRLTVRLVAPACGPLRTLWWALTSRPVVICGLSGTPAQLAGRGEPEASQLATSEERLTPAFWPPER